MELDICVDYRLIECVVGVLIPRAGQDAEVKTMTDSEFPARLYETEGIGSTWSGPINVPQLPLTSFRKQVCISVQAIADPSNRQSDGSVNPAIHSSGISALLSIWIFWGINGSLGTRGSQRDAEEECCQQVV
ncbi:MAG TPA: hypothetical protein VEF05_14100 [Terriglobales bacterium]|nr:hypothetical protein [Terriglobales bacterium]